MSKRISNLAWVISIIICLSFPLSVQAGKFRVLVVMSYEQANPWCKEIKEGIDSVLADTADLTYFYMDTKANLAGGEQKAKEANDLLNKLKPDGIISVDDNAQWMFVLPYLKDKVALPVMFCGVNAKAEKYGYPTSNVSGVLERGHIRESIAFTKQLFPSLKTVGFLAKDSPSGKALQRQIESEAGSYIVTTSSVFLANNINEVVAFGEEQGERSDAIFVDSLEGVYDEESTPLSNKEILAVLSKVYTKPLIGSNSYHVKQGALCAVVKTGQEQGNTAATMLLKAMQGTPVSEIPITQNYKGRRVINVTVMKALGIHPRPIVLVGAKLVKTEN